tara:strand:- start:1095 stop:1724 length:630 start_codon:yes stop_codon:yes gene_type:complete
MENEVVSYLRCACPKCKNPVPTKARKYCSDKCLKKAMTLRNMETYKGVYSEFGENSGPRSMISESSIRKDETHVTGNGQFAVDDYPVDPDIYAIAEANHEQYILDRNEHEARVVLDGLLIFQEEYDKHHEVSYAREQAKKREANLTEDQKIARINQSKQYQKENKEKINAKQKERYAADKEKYREYSKKYYERKKEIIAEARKIRSKRS